MATINEDLLERALSVTDLTVESDPPHAVYLVLQRMVDVLRQEMDCETRMHPAHPRVLPAEDHYTKMGFGTSSRVDDLSFAYQTSGGECLQKRTTAHVPSALRTLVSGPVQHDNVLLVVPGLSYRRDSIDPTHLGVYHQVDFWNVVRRDSPFSTDDLTRMVHVAVRAVLPGEHPRLVDARHVFNSTGRQIDVIHGNGELEIGECGIATTALLERNGLGNGFQCRSMGLGLDRLVMLRKGIDDIRLLRACRPDIARQMTDLDPYVPVEMPPRTLLRLDVVLPGPVSIEEIGAQLRETLVDDADVVESVSSPTARTDDEMLDGEVSLEVEIGPIERPITSETLHRLRRTISEAVEHPLLDRMPPHGFLTSHAADVDPARQGEPMRVGTD